jgi:(R,R)-butanediol dehydrogenase/meso-butanediol dehydrogenase/diacetyl reductase
MPRPELPTSMRAAVYLAPHKLEIQQREVPALAPHEVLLEVSHCGVCGTDLHVVLEGMGMPNSVGGHEYSGRIAALGDAVEGWSIGDAVVGGADAACGLCDCCLAGRPSLCQGRAGPGVDGTDRMGAFADYVKIEAARLLRVPDGLSLRDAALAEPLAVALHSLTTSRIEPGQRALVTGAGPLGLLVIAALRARGIDDVTASEPHPLRAQRAREVGASAFVSPEDLVAPAMPFTIVDEPYDAAFECSGNPRAMEAALGQLKRMGTLVIVGTGMRRPKFDHNRILLNELIVTGAYCYDEGGFQDALALLASGALPTQHLIAASDVELPDILDAIEGLGRGEIGGKVMIVPRRET